MKAVFLDRDGVINPLCGVDEQGHPESPLRVSEFQIFDFVGRSIRLLNKMGYQVFVVTNQPAAAKGKMTLDELAEMNVKLHMHAIGAGGSIKRIYTCLHHPDEKQVVRKALLSICDCRKPKPGMIFRAASEFAISLSRSWMVGDSWKDIVAGQSAGCRTILVGIQKNNLKCDPDFRADDLEKAVEIIQRNTIREVRSD